MSNYIASLFMCAVLIFSVGCQQQETGYSQASLEASQAAAGVLITQDQANQTVDNFKATFNAMGSSNFEAKLNSLFSDKIIYINDTLSEHHSKSSLFTYFAPMNKRVNNMQLEILKQYYDGSDLYLHWTMKFDLNLMSKKMTMFSSGVSHLKIDAQGKVIYQQDYWDPNNGLYRKLPYIGWLYRLLLPLK